MTSEKVAALPEPSSRIREVTIPPPRNFARLRSALEHGYGEAREHLESAATRTARALVVSGLEKHSGTPLRLLYFGSGNHLAYVLGLAYREHRIEEQHDDLRIWSARRWMERRGQDADLVIADLPWPYDRMLRGRGFIEIPAWVNQRMPLPDHWQEVLAQFRRSAREVGLRNIRKHKLQYRLVHDEEAVHRFYHEMYVPHVTRRFADAAYIEPEWKIQYCVENGSLMEILRDGKVVAAQVLWGNRQSMRFLWNGTVGEEFGSQSQGIFSALYYFGILHSFEGGYSEADFSGSRPVISDGVFQLKRRWGGQVFDGWSRDSLFVRPNNLNPPNLEFLVQNPLIARCRRDLVGKVLFGSEPVGPEQIERARQVYASAGLKAIRMYSLQPPQQASWDVVRSAPGIELVDLSDEPNPEITYCTC